MRPGIAYGDIVAARERIATFIVRTPAVAAAALSERLGIRLSLKLESRQRTGSFKDRGAANRLLALDAAQRARGVIAMSAGNHAQAVAHQGRRLGIAATIVMPETTPFTKVRRTEGFGATVVLSGENLSDAGVRAEAMARETGSTLIHPYDDARIVAGQGTAALEFLEDAADLDVLVVPVGGGGLISGVALAAKHLRPSLRVVGVQTAAYPSLPRALRGEGPPPGVPTIAEGIAVKAIGALNLEIIRDLVDEVVLVGESSLEEAMHLLLEEEKIVAEGAGAAALAAILDAPARYANRNVGAIVSGGNIDTGMLANVIQRTRLREGRVVRVRVGINDRPGVLAEVAKIIGDCGGNILDVEHQRLLHDVPSKNAELDITVETRSLGDLDRIRKNLEASGYATGILESTSART